MNGSSVLQILAAMLLILGLVMLCMMLSGNDKLSIAAALGPLIMASSLFIISKSKAVKKD